MTHQLLKDSQHSTSGDFATGSTELDKALLFMGKEATVHESVHSSSEVVSDGDISRNMDLFKSSVRLIDNGDSVGKCDCPGCLTPTTLSCECGTAKYCSKECQMQDRSRHRLMCRTIMAFSANVSSKSTIEKKKRCGTCSDHICKPGNCNLCACCGTHEAGPKRCGECNTLHYCSTDCFNKGKRKQGSVDTTRSSPTMVVDTVSSSSSEVSPHVMNLTCKCKIPCMDAGSDTPHGSHGFHCQKAYDMARADVVGGKGHKSHITTSDKRERKSKSSSKSGGSKTDLYEGGYKRQVKEKSYDDYIAEMVEKMKEDRDWETYVKEAINNIIAIKRSCYMCDTI